MTGPPGASGSDRVYRGIFALAAVYNLAFGAWTGLFPDAFFTWTGLEPPRHPVIWQCLGMVVGVYGLAYAYAARHLERARPFIAIGLLGKVLGPIGWIWTVSAGEWPVQTYTLIVYNDLIWWLPFGLFLLRGTRVPGRLRRAVPWICTGVHAVVSAYTLALLRPGTEAVPDVAARVEWIGSHLAIWRAGWAGWGLAALSLLAFLAWWARRLDWSPGATAGLCIAAAGIAFDLGGGSIYIGWLHETEHPGTVARVASLLTAGTANGLYCLGGIALTLATPLRRTWLRVWAWATWLVGLGFTGAAAWGHPTAVEATGALTMALFIPLPVLLARALRADGRGDPEDPEDPVAGAAPA